LPWIQWIQGLGRIQLWKFFAKGFQFVPNFSHNGIPSIRWTRGFRSVYANNFEKRARRYGGFVSPFKNESFVIVRFEKPF
jgi:hypothetical protein